MLKWFYSPKLIKKRKIRGQKQLLYFSFRSQYCFLCCCICLLDSNRGLFGLHYSTISEIFFLIWFKNLCLLKSVNAVPRTSLFYRLFQSRIAQSLTVTKLDCYKVAKSFTLKIFDFLYSGVLFSYGPLKLIIVNVLFGIFKCYPSFGFGSVRIVGSHIEGEIQRWQSIMFLKVLCQHEILFWLKRYLLC